MPTGLDIMAVLGSREAEAMLRRRGDFTKYTGYARRLAALQQVVAAMPPEAWRTTAYQLWLQTLRALAAEAGLERRAGGRGRACAACRTGGAARRGSEPSNAALADGPNYVTIRSCMPNRA